MFLVQIILSWANGFSVRQWFEAAAAVAIFVFVLYWDHLEIQKGRDEVTELQAKVNAKAQKTADEDASAAHQKLHADVANITAPLPGYLQIYGDKSRESDCPLVPYQRKSQL